MPFSDSDRRAQEAYAEQIEKMPHVAEWSETAHLVDNTILVILAGVVMPDIDRPTQIVLSSRLIEFIVADDQIYRSDSKFWLRAFDWINQDNVHPEVAKRFALEAKKTLEERGQWNDLKSIDATSRLLSKAGIA